MLFVIVMSCTAGSSTGCVIPPPDQQVADAAGFHAPRFLTLFTKPSFDEEMVNVRQTPAGQPPTETGFNVGLEDVDNQMLYLRLFIHQAGKIPAYNTPGVPFSPDRLQITDRRGTLLFFISGLCDQLVNNTIARYYLEIYVSDTPFLDVGRDNKVGGYRINDQWLIDCIRAPGTADGGV